MPVSGAALGVLAAFAPTLAATNNLTRSASPNLRQPHTYANRDRAARWRHLPGRRWPVRTIPGDGSVRLISIGGGTGGPLLPQRPDGRHDPGWDEQYDIPRRERRIGGGTDLHIRPGTSARHPRWNLQHDNVSRIDQFLPGRRDRCGRGPWRRPHRGRRRGVPWRRLQLRPLCRQRRRIGAHYRWHQQHHPARRDPEQCLLQQHRRFGGCPGALTAAPEPGSLALLSAMLGVLAFGHGMQRARSRIA